jgi:hypothetical protein
MPDISMCQVTDCDRSARCRRHRDSGTIPSEMQWYMMPEERGAKCVHFWDWVDERAEARAAKA